MTATFTISGRMTGANEYIRELNSDRNAGNRIKRRETDRAAWSARAAHMPTFFRPVQVSFLWVEPNRRRDLDNVAFAKKFVLDGLVRAQVIANDTAACVTALHDRFAYDREHPRVEVTVTDEVGA